MPDWSRILALTHKGFELTRKGHDARAAEKYDSAAEEVEKTLRVPDCLVACALREGQLDALLRHATTPPQPADTFDALREACLRLLPSVMAVLERRKASGTLLPGSCRPVEEAFMTAKKRHELELLAQPSAAEHAALLAPYLGLETYFRVASSVAYVLYYAIVVQELPFVLSDEQKDAAFLFLSSALDLIALPRDYSSCLLGEPGLVRVLRMLVPAVSDTDEPETKQLCAAWQRMLGSGVLQARGIDKGIDKTIKHHQRIRATADEDLAAGLLQQCALAGCAAREAHVSHFKKCGACRTVCYCSREHQVEDWPSHKAACKAARKAASDPAGASSA